jgi:hypothetical protein
MSSAFSKPIWVYSQLSKDILQLLAILLRENRLTYKSNCRITDGGDDTTWHQEDLHISYDSGLR